MIDAIIEITDFSTIYTLYIGIVFGLTIKFFWRWKIGDTFIDSLCTSSELTFNLNNTSFRYKCWGSISPILHFIIRYVRRKDGSADDPDGPHFLYQS